MKIAIISTDKLTEIDGVPVRLWEGVTESGIECKVFVHRVAALNKDSAQFEKELKAQLLPGQKIPLRNIL